MKEKFLEEKLFILNAFIDSSVNQGIIGVDTQGRIILYNRYASEHEELEVDEVLGKHLTEVYHYYNDSKILTVLKTGKPIVDNNMQYRTIHGKLIRSFGCIYPVKKEGKTVAVFAVARYLDTIRHLLSKTIDLQKQLLSSNQQLSNGTRFTFEDIIGKSSAITSAIEKAKKAAFSHSPVLLYGETGTGKELFAQGIHNAGVFKDEPFVAINCAAIPDSLLESTLFGTTKGAFTGAENSEGLFEHAGNGTVFLDEINSMPPDLQSKLLRVLQEKTVRRIGGKELIPIRCRIISSTNEDPWECVKNGKLRDDLYYRLSVVCINIPPLRQRGSDILLLAEYFLEKYSGIYGNKIKMSEEFQQAICNYSWPGNVRELEHAIESSLIMLEMGETLSLRHLPPHLNLFSAHDNWTEHRPEKIAPLKETLLNTEKEEILKALDIHNWNISRSANALGIGRSNLQYRMNKLGIKNRNMIK